MHHLTPFQKVSAFMNELVQQIGENKFFEERVVTIPVLYGGEFGPDLEYVAKYHGLSVDEVIQIHSESELFSLYDWICSRVSIYGGNE